MRAIPSTHNSVLTDEINYWLLENNNSANNTTRKLFLDCTVGGGGHSEELLRMDSNLFIVALDQDSNALEISKKRLGMFDDRTFFIKGNFRNIRELMFRSERALLEKIQMGDEPGPEEILFDGILADIGISSDQLDSPARGFSFREDSPLDMRMDPSGGLTADDIVNKYSFAQLKSVFYHGGVGTLSPILAGEIIKSRPVNGTRDLANICSRVVKRAKQKKGDSITHNPATVPFQAIRIAVNDELNALHEFLDQSIDLLGPGGRLGVISFHSLEDKLVAGTMRKWSRVDATQAKLLGSSASIGKLLTGKAIVPSEKEIRENPRSRSARMRIFEKRII